MNIEASFLFGALVFVVCVFCFVLFCYKELRSRKMKRNEKTRHYSRTDIVVPTILDAGEKKAGGRAGRVPPRLGKRG
jgi:Na+/melibiose symporter-like transporter